MYKRKTLLLFSLILFLIFNLSLTNSSFHEAQKDYLRGSEALIKGEYRLAREAYSNLLDDLKHHPQYKPYFAFNYYQEPILSIVDAREKLGNVQPDLIHKIKVIYLMHTKVALPLGPGKKTKVEVALSKEEIKNTQIYLGLFKVYLEVLSEGKLSVEYSFTKINNPISLMNEFSALDYENRIYHSRYPELSSVKGLDRFIFSSLNDTDTFLFYYKSKGSNPRPLGGSVFLPVISYFLNGPMRGRLLIPVEYNNPGVLLHEFFIL